MSKDYTEDNLVQQPTAEFFNEKLGWDSAYAYNQEGLGPESLLGRESEKEVVLKRYLKEALIKLNPDLPPEVYTTAIKEIGATTNATQLESPNREKYRLYRGRVKVPYRDREGEIKEASLKVFDFDKPDNNHFLVVRELWIQGVTYRRRADIIGFVNGIPLLFIELKAVHRNIRHAYDDNLADYKTTIPHLFDHNGMIILSNGDEAKVGTISSRYEHFMDWKRLDEEDDGSLDFKIMLQGMCNKTNFMDLLENYILFDESHGRIVKILARNHQFLGVNKALVSVAERENREGRLGIFWHTQGSGKSYSMVFLTRKISRKLHGNFTFLIITDRIELDSQIYGTYAGTDTVQGNKCRPKNGKTLKQRMAEDHPYLFTTIQKFNEDLKEGECYSERSDIIVISDEAHRTQYGSLALNMRNALPNASFFGFTGTPLFKDDEISVRIFGDYISTYDFQRAVEDGATVPLHYESRGEKLGLATSEINEKIAEALKEEDLDLDQQSLLEKELNRDYHILTADSRLDQIARDFVEHYSLRWESGKAMFICIDKLTTVKMYNLVQKYWKEKINELITGIDTLPDPQEIAPAMRKIDWMKETMMAVVVSEEQNEINKFKKYELEIEPHRKFMKDGFTTEDGNTLQLDDAFKKDEHPFRVAFVCAMWLTGFDVKSLATLYLDKPLKTHTLMQTIARANRVHEGKENGLIVDYCGILKNLRKALAEYAKGKKSTSGGKEPGEDDSDLLLKNLANSILFVKENLLRLDVTFESIQQSDGFDKISAIRNSINSINKNDRTRKSFELAARDVFKKFKAAIHLREEIREYKPDYDVINTLYKKLQEGRDQADISDVIKKLHDIVENEIKTLPGSVKEDSGIYDISHINFEILAKEFEKSKTKNTDVQMLKDVIEEKLDKMLKKNPTRIDYNQRYTDIIKDYNGEKDQVTIEETFAKLMKFVEDLTTEETRAIREGLENDEYLALYDRLVKPDLDKKSIKKLKKIAKELIEKLKSEKLKIDHWRDKESTRAEVHQFIHDYLYEETTGLPVESYTEDEVNLYTEKVYEHVFEKYPSIEESPYSAA